MDLECLEVDSEVPRKKMRPVQGQIVISQGHHDTEMGTSFPCSDDEEVCSLV
jgi:hypothetical protein